MGSDAQHDFVLAEPNAQCPEGADIEDAAVCDKAGKQIDASKGWTYPSRGLQQGSWEGVPTKCSIQVSRDKAPHFSTAATSDNRRMSEFQMVCRALQQAGLHHCEDIMTFWSCFVCICAVGHVQ